jgi:hypothetical protein
MRQSGKKRITEATNEGSSRAEGPFIMLLCYTRKSRESRMKGRRLPLIEAGIKRDYSK